MIYPAVNKPIIQLIPSDAVNILDVGCGTGALGIEIKRLRKCQITGITWSAEEAELALNGLDKVVCEDLEDYGGNDLGVFDCVICSHVLEHLSDPHRVLRMLRPHLCRRARVIVALPNVLWWKQRAKFTLGHFRYADWGLMDRTHRHFFDWTTARNLFPETGYQLLGAVADGGFPCSRFLGPMRKPLDNVALKVSPGLFGWQFILHGEPIER